MRQPLEHSVYVGTTQNGRMAWGGSCTLGKVGQPCGPPLARYCPEAAAKAPGVPFCTNRRMVPPGWVPGTPAWKHHSDAQPKLLFLGRISPGIKEPRTACWNRLKAILGDRLEVRTNVWSTADFQALVAEGDYVFLSMHKACGNPSKPLESLRMSKYLSSGQLVISETSDAKDMARYQGLVTFANSSSITDAFLQIANMSLAQRRQRGHYVYQEYKTKHAPHRILHHSGVFDMLDQHFDTTVAAQADT